MVWASSLVVVVNHKGSAHSLIQRFSACVGLSHTGLVSRPMNLLTTTAEFTET